MYLPIEVVNSKESPDTLYVAVNKINANFGAVDSAINDAVNAMANGLNYQHSVVTRGFSAAPTSGVSIGSRYIVSATPQVGDPWEGKVDNIAELISVSPYMWEFIIPSVGFCLTVVDENLEYVYTGTAWVSRPSAEYHNQLGGLQGGSNDERYHVSQSVSASLASGIITSHVHNGTDSAIVDHISLNNKGLNTHSEIDTAVSNSVNHIAAATPHAGHEVISAKNAANGYCGLDANTKISVDRLPSVVLGALNYQGVFDASSGSYPVDPLKGYYWIISVQGTLNSILFRVGDWLTYDGTNWDKIDNATLVSSVAGKTGAVTLTKVDVGLSNVANVDTTTTLNITDSFDKRFITDAYNAALAGTQGAPGDANRFVTTTDPRLTNVVVTTQLITAGEPLAQYQLVYSLAGKFYIARTDGVAQALNIAGIVLDATIAADAQGLIIVNPTLITNPAWTMTQGYPQYLASNGGITEIKPNENVVAVGIAVSTTSLMFNPSPPPSWPAIIDVNTDQLEVEYAPTAYTPTQTATTTDTTQLGSHLAGINAVFADILARLAAHSI